MTRLRRRPQNFRAEIKLLGVNPYVDVPRHVSEAFQIRGNVPVTGTVDREAFRSTLVPTGGGRHRLYINTAMRRAAQVDVGDRVDIVVKFDSESRTQPVPKPLAQALDADPEAKMAWRSLRPSRRKEILVYLNWLKRPESLERNVRRTIADLRRRRGKGRSNRS